MTLDVIFSVAYTKMTLELYRVDIPLFLIVWEILHKCSIGGIPEWVVTGLEIDIITFNNLFPSFEITVKFQRQDSLTTRIHNIAQLISDNWRMKTLSTISTLLFQGTKIRALLTYFFSCRMRRLHIRFFVTYSTTLEKDGYMCGSSQLQGTLYIKIWGRGEGGGVLEMGLSILYIKSWGSKLRWVGFKFRVNSLNLEN